jgi:hypothetical protein
MKEPIACLLSPSGRRIPRRLGVATTPKYAESLTLNVELILAICNGFAVICFYQTY